MYCTVSYWYRRNKILDFELITCSSNLSLKDVIWIYHWPITMSYTGPVIAVHVNDLAAIVAKPSGATFTYISLGMWLLIHAGIKVNPWPTWPVYWYIYKCVMAICCNNAIFFWNFSREINFCFPLYLHFFLLQSSSPTLSRVCGANYLKNNGIFFYCGHFSSLH